MNEKNYLTVLTSEMIKKSVSKYRLSKDLLIPESTLSQNFNNKTEMSAVNLLKISNYLKIKSI
jgi:hypothetical protein